MKDRPLRKLSGLLACAKECEIGRGRMTPDEIQHEKNLRALQEKDIERTDGCPMSFYVHATGSVAAVDSTGIFREHFHIAPYTVRDSRHFSPQFSHSFTRGHFAMQGQPAGRVKEV